MRFRMARYTVERVRPLFSVLCRCLAEIEPWYCPHYLPKVCGFRYCENMNKKESAQFPKELQRVLDLLQSDTRVHAILLFGSFATGNVNPQSDIDIAIAATPPLPKKEYLAILAEISGESIRKIDLINLDDAHAPLLQEIFRKGTWVKRNNSIYYRTLKRALFEAADFLPLKQYIQKKRVGRFIQ